MASIQETDKRSLGSDALTRLASYPRRSLAGVENMGSQLAFYVKTFAWIPRTLRRYRREVLRLLAEVSLGAGALAVIGGTVFVIAALTTAAGIEVGLEAYTSMGHIGVGALAGFFSAYFNTREVSPIVAGIALTATVGASFTAQLGAMRVSEEIDALEVMAVPSVPFLVTTRVIAGALAIIPLFAIAVIVTFAATRVVVVQGFGQAVGTYDHYFQTFLIPGDLLLSIVKVLLMALAIMSICCYYGYNASGGPAGVGRAVGQAVRAALITVMLLDLVFGLAFWSGPSVHVAG